MVGELSGGNDFESIAAGLIDDRLEVEDADVFRRNGEDVVGSTRVGCKGQVVNRIGDVGDSFGLRPLPVVFAVLKDEDFRFVVGVVTAGGNHWSVETKQRRVPADARKWNFADDFVL